ncbi:PREDICTED: thiopurine S-methyltransferase isoform X2 [Nanorana parkeri]|uniref:thiopurine S-methyltransferase isoform X2 n=1 Tax=Nanorana parkeri TaxID=125878 RepID=UPI000854EE58|nr:PREDICTED: thiopurine S-methyltransferase isoform X2 [Nanorana parkeri]
MSNCPNFTETKQDRVLTEKDWKEKWETRCIGFHEKDVHPLLTEFLNEMINGKEKLNIFFPLCGKAVDMKWLADMGHNIVGVDVAELGLKEFFEEQNVPYVEEEVPEIPGAKVFKSISGNISLYCCNLYNISSSIIGRVDGIWDRGALVAVNPCDRERYTSCLLSLLNKDSRYLLVVLEYDPKLISGPPFYVPESDIEQLFGSTCKYKLLKKIYALTDRQKQWGLDYYYEKIYLVTPKSLS